MRPRRSAVAWWPRRASCGTGPWRILRPAGVRSTSSSRSCEPGRTRCLRVVDGVAFSVEELRHRLASAEDAARVEAEEAGQRAAQEPDHGDLEELEEELVAGAAGVGAGVGKDGVAAGGPVSGLEESTAASDEISEEEPSAEGEPEQAGSPSSRRSVDELFARIRASRAAEEAAAAGGAGAAGAGGAAGAAGAAGGASGDSEAAGGLYDIEAVTAAEAGGAISAEKELSEAAEQAELEAEGAGEGAGDGGDAGDGEPLDITRAVEIVTIVEGPGVAGDVGGGTGGGPAAAPGSGAGAAGAEGGPMPPAPLRPAPLWPAQPRPAQRTSPRKRSPHRSRRQRRRSRLTRSPSPTSRRWPGATTCSGQSPPSSGER